MSTWYNSVFRIDGFLATASVPIPPPYIPEDPRASLSSAAVDGIVPSFYIVSSRNDEQRTLERVELLVHNLSADRALELAGQLEAAAKRLREPCNHDRVLDREDPGVTIDISAAVIREQSKRSA